ncbi:alpha/beta hydrolase [Paenibacillus ihumii]|uniref:alpha/beta hydrolase n=1 Tax=Paenibacillus ihumii TaxID=687436 RepID=UPI0006D84D4C|nr:alpha/beta hydrolase [Paenibacillus ihumii]
MDSAKYTIEKTISISFVSDAFWDRWLGIGLPKPVVYELRQRVTGIESWTEVLQGHAAVYEQLASKLLHQQLISEAEYFYRSAAVNYNLIQWMYPHTGRDKQLWYERCIDMHRQADGLAEDEIVEAEILVEGNKCSGRIRTPKHPRGCVIIIYPIDSSKEELIKYEIGFAREGFITISFDGPGQGETYVLNRSLATRRGWELFIHKLIELAAQQFPGLPLHLFGTSFGGSWAIEGSRHSSIGRVAAVSPVLESQGRLPDYFKERLAYVIKGEESPLELKEENIGQSGPLLLIHGQMDDWVKEEEIRSFYRRISAEKQLIEYPDERHACSSRMDDIIQAASEWYTRGL